MICSHSLPKRVELAARDGAEIGKQGGPASRALSPSAYGTSSASQKLRPLLQVLPASSRAAAPGAADCARRTVPKIRRHLPLSSNKNRRLQSEIHSRCGLGGGER